MKLRQKLAVALASAMVITSVPVVTMAASTNTLTKEILQVGKNDVLDRTTNQNIKIDFKDAKAGDKEVFYLELQNAEWALDGQTLPAGITYEKQTDEIVKVTYTLTQDGEKVHFPIMAKVTGGEAKVSVVSKGGNTTVTSSTFVFATTADGQAIVTADKNDIPTLYTEGTIADIIITESMKDAFKGLNDDEREIELTIENDDFEFVNGGTVKFAYGFAGQNNAESAVTTTVKAKDKQTLIVTLPKELKSDSIGQIKLEDVKVKSTVKNPTTGDLTIAVDGDAVKSTDSIKVAEISAYGSAIKEDKKEIKAGDKKEVKFELVETEKSSFVNGRDVEFTIDKGFFMNQEVDKDGEYDEAATLKAVKAAITVKNTEVNKDLEITDVEVKDEKVVGFTATMVSSTDVKDVIEVKANITAGLEEEGDVTVAVAGRALEKEVTAVIANISKTVEVATEAATLKVGLQGQTAGKITLTEAEKATFKSGKEIILTIPVEKGITVKSAPTVKVTDGDIQMDDAKLSKVKGSGDDKYVEITIPVKRTSKTASTIEISNIEFTTDRTVAEGAFDITLGGTALSPATVAETIELKEFLVVGTPNTEDLSASNGLAKGTAAFVIGEATYTANGTTREMDAQSYIQDPGFTMVPVRYVAEAFGVKANDILFSNGTATIFAGNRTIQLTAGSDIAVVNGAAIKMGTKVVVKEGRTYAPVGEIARILGISTKWDSATKTATFENK